MKKQLLFLLSLFYFLFSCSKKEKTNIEKKWVATVNSDYRLLTTLEDSLSYRWEGGDFEGVIHGNGKIYAYYEDSLVSTKEIEAYYGATCQEDIISSGKDKYIGSIKDSKFSGFGVLVKPNELYIGEFVESHPNGYLIYYKNGKRSYIGMWEHGKRTGRGSNYREDGKIISGIWKDDAIFELDTTLTTEKGIFKGLLRNSSPQGYGEMNYFSGSQYKGDWNNGKMEGEGTFTTATDTLIGEWKDGKLNGYGLCKTLSFLFKGDLKDNKPEGMGYIFFTDSTFYSGGWANGKMNGYGDITLSNGDTYMGNWKDDQYHGGGRYTYHTGEAYDGYWKEGLQDSLGTYTCKDYTYKGQWEEGWINGQGKITYSNGDYYEGDFVENQKYGVGYYHFSNGNTYDGEFVDNKFNGLGIFIFKNGSRYQGEFRDGKIKGDGTLFLKEGKETIAITANWDGSIKFPKAASVLFENGDLYEGELDSAGFPTKNGVWTSAEDREKGITAFEKTLSRANEFYKKHRDTWNDVVLYTSLALTGVELAAPVVATVIAFTPLAPAVYGVGVAAGGINTALNTVDAAIAIASASVDVYEGIRDDDPEKAKEGGKTLVKEVAINAAFIFAPKILKSNPARKLTKKLSEVAIKVGKPFVHFAKNKVFGRVTKLVKNGSGVIEKQWVQIVDKVWINSELHLFTERLAKKMDDQFITQAYYNLKSKLIMKQDLGKPANGTILFKNMMLFQENKKIKAILKEKVLSKRLGQKGFQAHHVVAGNSPTAKKTRKILEKCGIDINDARNGILLPMHSKSIFKGSLHGNHIRKYDEIVYERILEAYKKAGRKGVKEALDNIKKDLYKGNIQLLSKDKHYVNRLWNSFSNIRR